jgi:DNA-binding beta-propeller fold protein YncE
MAYVLDADGGILVPVDLATNTAGKPVHLSLIFAENAIAVSPSGATVYVTGTTSTSNPVLEPVSATTGAVGKPISLAEPNGFPPSAIAVAPNGQAAYVIGGTGESGPELIPIDLVHNVAKTPIPLPRAEYLAIAITPDSSTALLGSALSITPVDLRTGEVKNAIDLGGGSSGRIVLSPTGHTAYVTRRNASRQDYLVAVDLLTRSVTPIAQLPGIAQLVAITPNGSTAYLADQSGTPTSPDSNLLPVDLTRDTVGRPIHLPFAEVMGLAITPDGQSIYASGLSTVSGPGAGVAQIGLSAGTINGLIPMPGSPPTGPGGIIFAP